MKQSELDFFRAALKQPLVVCCGVGRDSIAMLVGLWLHGIIPDLILFADTGSERQATYDYIPILRDWLKRVGFPDLTIVRYQPEKYKHWPPYYSLEENLLTNSTLASIAYGFHSCSSKWKITPQNKFIDQWAPAIQAWANGMKVRKAIGFDASPHERRRAHGCSTYAIQDDELEKYDLWFPLQEWGWDLERCIMEIEANGLPVPEKSSCYFCTAMKPWELEKLAATEPDKLRKIIVIEKRASERNLEYARERFDKYQKWLQDPKQIDPSDRVHKRSPAAVLKDLRKMAAKPEGDYTRWEWNGEPLTDGLWRKPIKGIRNNTPRPGSMTEYIQQKGLLPADEINRIQSLTPTTPLSNEDMHQLGVSNWQDWVKTIIA